MGRESRITPREGPVGEYRERACAATAQCAGAHGVIMPGWARRKRVYVLVTGNTDKRQGCEVMVEGWGPLE
jgi:hypothetical protein